jgi:hypothetical protein
MWGARVPLESLTYMSAAIHRPSQSEIEHLLERARARNLEEGVTGVLLYSDGSFIQCIEGTSASLDRVYRHILADPLHHRVFEILREPIEHREFGDWVMAFRSTGPEHTFEAEVGLSERLSAPRGVMSPVRHLLSAFWNGGMGHRFQVAVG